MIQRLSLMLLLATVFTVPVDTIAQPTPVTTSRAIQSQAQISADAVSNELLARDWGLHQDEWTRYRQVMQGPLGVYSPNLDPLTALGIEARSDEERNRYAELQVQAEARRVEKLLTYQRAYDAAWQRLFPDQPRVSLAGALSSNSSHTESKRLAVFVKADCPACEQRARQLQAAGTPFDLYLVGSERDDTRLRQWAAHAGIDPAKVRAHTITLNHDAGRWLFLGVSGDLPAVVHQVNGQWQRQ